MGELIDLLLNLFFFSKDDNDRSIVGESPMDRRAKWIWRCALIGLILTGFGIYCYLKRGA